MAPEELNRRQSEIVKKYQETEKVLGQQVAALLTPRQLAALKEIQFRRAVASAVHDSAAQKKLGMTDPQKAQVRRIDQEQQEADRLLCRDTIKKSLAVLTAAQRQKLREELDRRGW